MATTRVEYDTLIAIGEALSASALAVKRTAAINPHANEMGTVLPARLAARIDKAARLAAELDTLLGVIRDSVDYWPNDLPVAPLRSLPTETP